MADLFDTSPLPAAPGLFVRVALERGIDAQADGLTYAAPAGLADLEVGQRVIVPLGRGNKPLIGYVVELSRNAGLPTAKMRTIKQIIGRVPGSVSLTNELIQLARWLAGYYCAPLGMVLATMLPAAVKRGTGTIHELLVSLPPETSPPASPQTSPGAPAKIEPERVPPQTTSSSADAASTEAGIVGGPADVDGGRKKVRVGGARLSSLQQKILATMRDLAQQGRTWLPQKELADHAGARTVGPVKSLVSRGLLITRDEAGVRAAPVEDAFLCDAAKTLDQPLTAAQKNAVEQLNARLGQGFSVTLLYGVTGSGKTEVYLRVIAELLRRNGIHVAPARGGADAAEQKDVTGPNLPSPGADKATALVLTPEIALTPQTVARFYVRFAQVGVAVLHSGLTPAQRHEQWQRIRDGKARVVVGARQAVYAPFPGGGPGIIIVDEEHEPTYKQDLLPRYNARDVAIKRAQLLGIPVVLGSGTPSLESWFNAHDSELPPTTASNDPAVGNQDSTKINHAGETTRAQKSRYHLLTLPDRVPGLTLPRVEIADLRDERRKRYQHTGAAGIHLLSLRLEILLRQTLEAGGQTILLLNRRGYANYIACADHRCGWLLNCEHCDATMVYHKDRQLPTGGLVRCHHCHAEQLLPALCPLCRRKLTVFGLGTQRVEEELARKFPAARIARMDSDSMRSVRDYHDMLQRFYRGELDVLLGTQIIAKGLDFPNVRLVGVISADTALHLPDFRAAERTFQLVSQVSGRAGRGERSGTVLVQTFSPDDPAIALAAHHDYPTFAARELALRCEAGLPPVSRMARIVVRHRDPNTCAQQARLLATRLADHNNQMFGLVRLRGPSACAIGRVAGFHRIQIELIATAASDIQKLLTAMRNKRMLIADTHMAVDVDPVNLM